MASPKYFIIINHAPFLSIRQNLSKSTTFKICSWPQTRSLCSTTSVCYAPLIHNYFYFWLNLLVLMMPFRKVSSIRLELERTVFIQLTYQFKLWKIWDKTRFYGFITFLCKQLYEFLTFSFRALHPKDQKIIQYDHQPSGSGQVSTFALFLLRMTTIHASMLLPNYMSSFAFFFVVFILGS